MGKITLKDAPKTKVGSDWMLGIDKGENLCSYGFTTIS